MKKIGMIGIGAVILGILGIVPLIDYQVSFFYYLMFWIAMASGINLIFGFTGYLPFGYAAFYGIGSYVTAVLWSNYSIHIIPAIFCGGIGAVILAILFSPTLKLKGVYFAIVSSSCALALKTIISCLPESWAGGSAGLNLSKIYAPEITYYLMMALMIGSVGTVLAISRSRIGIALKAIKQDKTAADIVGINVVRARMTVWLLATLIPGLAGGLDAWYTSVVDPESAFNMMIAAKAILYGMFGGFGTVIGPVVGVITLYTLDDFIWSILPMIDAFLIGLIMLLLIMFLPRGIMGSLFRRYPSLRNKVG